MMLSNFKYLHKAVWNFSKWYNSDIVGFYMGPYPVVAVHNAEAVREVLHRTDFDGRPGIYVASMRQPDNMLSGEVTLTRKLILFISYKIEVIYK